MGVHKGYKQSEQHKIKRGIFGKGRKFRPHTEEEKIKIGNAQRGIPKSKEHNKKNSEAQRGVKGHNWKGGLKLLRDSIRNCFKYRQWRSDVFTRDSFTCQLCFKSNGYLEAHHIKAYSKIISENNIKNLDDALMCEELWNINNGQTLCKVCHKSTDNYGNKKHGNP